MNKKKLIIIIIILLIAGILIWIFFGRKRNHEIVYETAEVTRGDVNTFVTATGTVEPITLVEVGTQVSGIVSKIYVDYNSPVTTGQVIAELDKTNLLNELASRRSNVATAQTEYEYQSRNYERFKTLHEKQLISDNDYELAYYSYQQAKNSYDISRNELAKAETNLGYATIYSPIDGVVLNKMVEEGQTVAASFSAPVLFTIAQDLTQMQVVARVDEADIGQVHEGQRVEFSVDAFPNDLFEGNVTQVRQEATVESNVVTYEVVINSPNPDLKLKPGLTANVTIYTIERNNVLSVPSRALRFDPESTEIGPQDRIVNVSGENKLWTYEDNTFTAHPVEIGINSGTRTEIISGIEEGTPIVTDAISGEQLELINSSNQQNGETSPFLPGRGRRR